MIERTFACAGCCSCPECRAAREQAALALEVLPEWHEENRQLKRDLGRLRQELRRLKRCLAPQRRAV